MAEKTKSTQEELPLHEVVLKLMFEFNKEKPAELTSTDIFWKISDPSLSEIQITQVLNWLVNEKRLEKFVGKYSLDRFEFLEQRKRYNAETNPESATSTESNEDIPLHETVLKIMYDASREKPEEMTPNDVFWKTSDPAISERNIAEVLTWLVSQRKVDHFAGKYSLDRFEFLEQKNAEKAEDKSDKKSPKAKKASQPKSSQDEVVPSKPAPEQKVPKDEKITPKPKVAPKVKAEPKSTKEVESGVREPLLKPQQKQKTQVKKSVDVEQPVQINSKRWDKVTTTLALIAGVIVIYMVYLISASMSNPDATSDVSSVQSDITRLEEQYDQLSEAQISSDQKVEILERKLAILKGITQKRSEQLSRYQQENRLTSDGNSVLLRLIVSNLLLFIILGAAVTRRI